MDKDMKRPNFKNMVSFYEAELKAIQAGESVCNILSSRERIKLKDMGILNYGIIPLKTYVTKDALKILKYSRRRCDQSRG